MRLSSIMWSIPSVFAVLSSRAVQGQEQLDAGAARVFDAFAPSVVIVEVIPVSSGVRSSSASGFFVSDRGHIVTNYHAIAEWVLAPNRFRIDVKDQAGSVRSAEVVAIDVVNDLAVLTGDLPSPRPLAFRQRSLAQGQRLYALGFPADLGIAIVEGTYNGILENHLTERIHFTGSLNPGMSGGPALTESGDVVGVNVSTAGNQLSLLVPARATRALVAEAMSNPNALSPDSILAVVGRQISLHQDRYVATLTTTEFPTVDLSGFQVPTRPAPFFECAGETFIDDRSRFGYTDHNCWTNSPIHVFDDYSAGVIEIYHRVIEAYGMNPFRFYRLYTQNVLQNDFWLGGSRESVTPFRCYDDNVEHEGRVFKVVLCARRLRRLEGLYDVVFKSAALGLGRTGVETTLRLSGVSFTNAVALARRILESVTWTQ